MSKNQSYEELLASFKRSNKKRKQKLAEKNGYSTIEDYKAHLESKALGKIIVKGKAKVPINKTIIPTIHIVDILDCSTSMAGRKIENALKAINEGISKLKSEKEFNYIYTLCTFSSAGIINFPVSNSIVSVVGRVSANPSGLTALYDAIGVTINKVKLNKEKPEDKVLINIYTDGEENASIKYSEDDIRALVSFSEEAGFTITFIGTENDTKNIIRKLKIKAGNTLSYDGSAKGLEESMNKNLVARASYSKAVADGLDVKDGYFKDLK